MAEAATHLRELAERIGPRPATTDTESEAADYIQARFEERGLETERQEFLAPRTYAWAFVVYHLMTIGAAVLADRYPAPAFALALLAAVIMWLDLDTRFGLSDLMRKGPSQNVIGRKPANARRGESVRKVVIVAHYDSARSSLAFHPSLVKDFGRTFGLMKIATWLVPVLALLALLDFSWVSSIQPWLWYATLFAAAYLLVPVVINVHRELFMPFVDGANDNASGVAAMLGVLEHAVPEVVERSDTQAMRAVIAAEAEPVAGAGVAPPEWVEDAERPTAPMDAVAGPPASTGPTSTPDLDETGLLTYSPAGPPEDYGFQDDRSPGGGLDDFEWEEPPVHIEGQRELDVAAATPPEPEAEGRADDVATVAGDPDVVEADEPEEPRHAPRRRRWFSRGRRGDNVSDWLGVGDDFDAVGEGRRIGSWEQFEDDESGSKGGSAGTDFDDASFAAEEAARIRHLITHGVDRGLDEKEIWFVATGAEETGTWGMRHFLSEHAEDLAGAAIINLDNVGAGTLSWVTREGMARRYSSDRRLMSAARRASHEMPEVRVKGREYRGLSTDATPALARGLRAMSVMAFDINGRLPNWHWRTDTTENVSVENIERAAEFTAEIVKSL